MPTIMEMIIAADAAARIRMENVLSTISAQVHNDFDTFDGEEFWELLLWFHNDSILDVPLALCKTWFSKDTHSYVEAKADFLQHANQRDGSMFYNAAVTEEIIEALQSQVCAWLPQDKMTWDGEEVSIQESDERVLGIYREIENAETGSVSEFICAI